MGLEFRKVCLCRGDPDSSSVLTDVSATSVTVNERHALMRPNKLRLENPHHSVTQCFPDEQCTTLRTGPLGDPWTVQDGPVDFRSESETVTDEVSYSTPQRDFGGE